MGLGALAGLVVGSVYFQNKISTVNGRVDLVEQHLRAVIPQINPNLVDQIQQIMSAINTLEARTIKTQEEVRALSQGKNLEPTSAPAVRTYQRLTQRKGDVPVIPAPVMEAALDDEIAMMRA